jgi:hypothetical protein
LYTSPEIESTIGYDNYFELVSIDYRKPVSQLEARGKAASVVWNKEETLWTSQITEKLAQLKHEIYTAFPSHEKCPDDLSDCSCDDCRAAVNHLAYKHWSEFTYDDVLNPTYDYAKFKSHVWPLALPGFLMWAVKRWSAESNVLWYIISTFSYTDTVETVCRSMTKDQIRIVSNILSLAAIDTRLAQFSLKEDAIKAYIMLSNHG